MFLKSLSDKYFYSSPETRFDESISMKTRGMFDGGYPDGVVVHYTAGRSMNGDKDAETTIQHGIKQGYGYWCISSTGKIYKTHPINEWGQHAGVSKYPGLGSYVSYKTIGIEVCCAGRVDKIKNGDGYTTWWGEYYGEDIVRSYCDLDGVRGGHYHKFTNEQEHALTDVILYLALGNSKFSIDNVIGHYECSVGRKLDPGWSLSMSMKRYREFLMEQFKMLKEGGQNGKQRWY